MMFPIDDYLPKCIWLYRNSGVRDIDWWIIHHEFGRFNVGFRTTEDRLAFIMAFCL